MTTLPQHGSPPPHTLSRESIVLFQFCSSISTAPGLKRGMTRSNSSGNMAWKAAETESYLGRGRGRRGGGEGTWRERPLIPNCTWEGEGGTKRRNMAWGCETSSRNLAGEACPCLIMQGRGQQAEEERARPSDVRWIGGVEGKGEEVGKMWEPVLVRDGSSSLQVGNRPKSVP